MNLAGLDEPFLIVLVGASGAGKSTWAQQRFRAGEIVSSDGLRAVVGTGDADLEASADAFAALDLVLAARLRRRLTTVLDTLGLEPDRRRGYLEQARRAGIPAVAVLLDTDGALCRARNRERDRPVPAAALGLQLRRMTEVVDEVAAEGWDAVVRVEGASAAPARSVRQDDPTPQAPDRLTFLLQISRFPWGEDPVRWLADVARAADEVGFSGVALMDHFIQIPQVGRTWDPIPEPWVTLGLLAGLPSSLRLGTLVSPASLHVPGRLAKAAATLDVLTGGRAFCGVGTGWWDREHAAYGVPFRSAAERVADLERCLRTLRALWRPGTKAYADEYVDLPETTCYPRPVGRLPLIVGARGPRVLSVAARLGDACNVLPAAIPLARRVMVGKPITVLDVPLLGRDRDHVAQLVERLRASASAASYARSHPVGTPDEHVLRYRQFAADGVSEVFIAPADLSGPDEVERFAPVLAAFR